MNPTARGANPSPQGLGVFTPSQPDPRILARDLTGRYFFVIAGIAFLIGAVIVTVAEWPLPGLRRVTPGLYAAAAVICLALRNASGERAAQAIVGFCVFAVVALALTATLNGTGMNSPGVGFMGVIVLFLATTTSLRTALLVAGLCAALLAGLALAEHKQWIAGPAALAGTPLPRRLISLWMMIVVASFGGLLITRLLQHWLHSTQEREIRFTTLLGVATDAYWEMNANYIVTLVLRRNPDGTFSSVAQPMKRPWDNPEMVYDEGALPAHRADLEERRSFRELHVAWRWGDGSMRHEVVSGAPRFDPHGKFQGYWGVSRDVTAEYLTRGELRSAEDAMRDSQALFKRLVEMSPDIITLTDVQTDKYIMVNATFERASGYSASEAIGRSATELGLWRDPHDRDRMKAALSFSDRIDNMAVDYVARDGTIVPMMVAVSLFKMNDKQYVVINARDMTRTERSRREREAILENASIGIAFTRGQRFMIVNRRFEQLFGWAPGTLHGQSTATIWPSDSEYREAGRRYIPLLARGEQIEYESTAQRKDGSRFICRILGKAVDSQRPRDGGTIWIVDDVTERRQEQQALAQARDAAEAANRAKSAFLANTSHEIRTPLNGLLGLARLARQSDVDEARRQIYLDQISDSAEALSAIISDILDLSKIEAGKLELETLVFDLHALLHTLHRAYSALADARGLSFELSIAPTVPQFVCGDPLRVRQILSNYLTNALKFTPSGGISLRATQIGQSRQRFEVRDTGPGIDAPTQSRLFQPFTQADDSTTRRYGGTGLGLSICRELAQLMGGEVGLSSHPGQGSCFHVELPLPAGQAEEASSDFAPLSQERLRGAHVLLVEDNAVNMLVASAMLEQWGVQVDQAHDGFQALEAVARANQRGAQFDAVLMDVQMPGISGYETTRELRKKHSAAELPIIALTAAALVSEREQALAIGMNDFLTKPIDAIRMRSVLARWLKAA